MRIARNSLIAALLVGIGFTQTVNAQETAYVRVDTNFPEAVVFADSIRLGTISGELVALPATVRTLRLLPPDVDTWSIAPVFKRIELTEGDTLEIQADFPYHYRIESVPFGATVHIEPDIGDRRHIGSTPTLYTSQRPISGKFLLQKPGYAATRVEPGERIWNRHVVELSPSEELDPTAAQVSWHPPRRHRTWIDYAALGAAVTAGAVAIHYKFKADDLYARYEETADPSLRSEIKAYDVRSGVAFGVMQAGIGIFAFRLAIR